MAMSMEDPKFSGTFIIPPRVPQGLAAAVEGLTREVIRHRPEDIYIFAAHHFDKLLRLREQYSTSFPRAEKNLQALWEMNDILQSKAKGRTRRDVAARSGWSFNETAKVLGKRRKHEGVDEPPRASRISGEHHVEKYVSSKSPPLEEVPRESSRSISRNSSTPKIMSQMNLPGSTGMLDAKDIKTELRRNRISGRGRRSEKVDGTASRKASTRRLPEKASRKVDDDRGVKNGQRLFESSARKTSRALSVDRMRERAMREKITGATSLEELQSSSYVEKVQKIVDETAPIIRNRVDELKSGGDPKNGGISRKHGPSGEIRETSKPLIESTSTESDRNVGPQGKGPKRLKKEEARRQRSSRNEEPIRTRTHDPNDSLEGIEPLTSESVESTPKSSLDADLSHSKASQSILEGINVVSRCPMRSNSARETRNADGLETLDLKVSLPAVRPSSSRNEYRGSFRNNNFVLPPISPEVPKSAKVREDIVLPILSPPSTSAVDKSPSSVAESVQNSEKDDSKTLNEEPRRQSDGEKTEDPKTPGKLDDDVPSRQEETKSTSGGDRESPERRVLDENTENDVNDEELMSLTNVETREVESEGAGAREEEVFRDSLNVTPDVEIRTRPDSLEREENDSSDKNEDTNLERYDLREKLMEIEEVGKNIEKMLDSNKTEEVLDLEVEENLKDKLREVEESEMRITGILNSSDLRQEREGSLKKKLGEVKSCEERIEDILSSDEKNHQLDLAKQDVELSENTETNLSKLEVELPENTETNLSKQEVELPENTETNLSNQEVELSENTETNLSKQEVELPENTETNLSKQEIELPENTETNLREMVVRRASLEGEANFENSIKQESNDSEPTDEVAEDANATALSNMTKMEPLESSDANPKVEVEFINLPREVSHETLAICKVDEDNSDSNSNWTPLNEGDMDRDKLHSKDNDNGDHPQKASEMQQSRNYLKIPHSYVLSEGSPHEIPESVVTVIIPDRVTVSPDSEILEIEKDDDKAQGPDLGLQNSVEAFGEVVKPEGVTPNADIDFIRAMKPGHELIIVHQDLDKIQEEEDKELDDDGTESQDARTDLAEIKEEDETDETQTKTEDPEGDLPDDKESAAEDNVGPGSHKIQSDSESTEAKETTITDELPEMQDFVDNSLDVEENTDAASMGSTNEVKESTLTDRTSLSLDPGKPIVPELNLDSLQDVTISSFKLTDDRKESDRTISLTENLTSDRKIDEDELILKTLIGAAGEEMENEDSKKGDGVVPDLGTSRSEDDEELILKTLLEGQNESEYVSDPEKISEISRGPENSREDVAIPDEESDKKEEMVDMRLEEDKDEVILLVEESNGLITKIENEEGSFDKETTDGVGKNSSAIEEATISEKKVGEESSQEEEEAKHLKKNPIEGHGVVEVVEEIGVSEDTPQNCRVQIPKLHTDDAKEKIADTQGEISHQGASEDEDGKSKKEEIEASEEATLEGMVEERGIEEQDALVGTGATEDPSSRNFSSSEEIVEETIAKEQVEAKEAPCKKVITWSNEEQSETKSPSGVSEEKGEMDFPQSEDFAEFADLEESNVDDDQTLESRSVSQCTTRRNSSVLLKKDEEEEENGGEETKEMEGQKKSGKNEEEEKNGSEETKEVEGTEMETESQKESEISAEGDTSAANGKGSGEATGGESNGEENMSQEKDGFEVRMGIEPLTEIDREKELEESSEKQLEEQLPPQAEVVTNNLEDQENFGTGRKEYHIYVPEPVGEANSSSSTETSTFNSAATKIQAGVRGFLTRRRLQSSTLDSVPSISDSFTVEPSTIATSCLSPIVELNNAKERDSSGSKARHRLRREDAVQGTTFSTDRAFAENGIQHTGEFHDCIPLPLGDFSDGGGPTLDPSDQHSKEENGTRKTKGPSNGQILENARVQVEEAQDSSGHPETPDREDPPEGGVPQTPGPLFFDPTNVPMTQQLDFNSKLGQIVDFLVLAKGGSNLDDSYLNFITSVEDVEGPPRVFEDPRKDENDSTGSLKEPLALPGGPKGVIIEEITSLDESSKGNVSGDDASDRMRRPESLSPRTPRMESQEMAGNEGPEGHETPVLESNTDKVLEDPEDHEKGNEKLENTEISGDRH